MNDLLVKIIGEIIIIILDIEDFIYRIIGKIQGVLDGLSKLVKRWW
jgi:hypothetical protein